MVMELKKIVERFGVKESESIICVNTILLEIEKHKSIPMQLPVMQKIAGKTFVALIKFRHCDGKEIEYKIDKINATTLEEAREKFEAVWYRNADIIEVIECYQQ